MSKNLQELSQDIVTTLVSAGDKMSRLRVMNTKVADFFRTRTNEIPPVLVGHFTQVGEEAAAVCKEVATLEADMATLARSVSDAASAPEPTPDVEAQLLKALNAFNRKLAKKTKQETATNTTQEEEAATPA